MRLVCAGVGAALVATLLDAPPAVAAPEGSKPSPVQQTKSGTGRDIAPKQSAKHPPNPAATRVAKPAWPTPGATVVTVPAAEARPEARAEGVSAGRKTRAGELPVWVGATSGSNAPFGSRCWTAGWPSGLDSPACSCDCPALTVLYPTARSRSMSTIPGFASAVGGDDESMADLAKSTDPEGLFDEALETTGSKPIKGKPEEIDGQLALPLVGKDGEKVHIALTGEPRILKVAATAGVATTFTYDEPVEIKAPPADEIFDPNG